MILKKYFLLEIVGIALCVYAVSALHKSAFIKFDIFRFCGLYIYTTFRLIVVLALICAGIPPYSMPIPSQIKANILVKSALHLPLTRQFLYKFFLNISLYFRKHIFCHGARGTNTFAPNMLIRVLGGATPLISKLINLHSDNFFKHLFS